MNPLGFDRVPVGQQSGEISIGWGRIGEALLNSRLGRQQFAALVHDAYYGRRPNKLGSGNAAGQLWRFIRAMSPGDLILVPHAAEIQLARVTGEPAFDANPSAEHWAYRRSAEWLTRARGLNRHQLEDSIQAAARTRLTCIEVPDLARHLAQLLPTSVRP